MPFRTWVCPDCGVEVITKVSSPTHCEDVAMELVLTAPGAKFMEKIDEDHGKSNLVGQQKILKERARTYSRDHETDDLIEMNPREAAHANKWITADGKKRKKIDDL